VNQDPLVRTVDPLSARRQLQRRGPARVAAHPLWTEASDRLADRLSYIRVDGAVRVDYGVELLGQSIQQPPGSVDMIWSVGLLAYLSDARSTLSFWAQLLKPGGLLMFCTLGPDSFRPLALALGDERHERHVPGFPDMHDVGDALVSLRMANPVMDVERIMLTYSTAEAALADLRALGGNPLLARAGGLSGRAWRQRVLSALESLRQGALIEIPVELVFGHAWAGQPRTDPATEAHPIRWQDKPTKKFG
jgi:SAM-dependent methyltransferase